MYIDENISYEKASSYMEVTTSLKGIYQDLDEYKNTPGACSTRGT